MNSTNLIKCGSPDQIKCGDSILVIRLKYRIYDQIILADDFNSHCDGFTPQPAQVNRIEKIGGCYILETSCGYMSLTNNNNGDITFIDKQKN